MSSWTSQHVFETARATGSRQFCAFLYRDEQNWIYFGVADVDILDQHMYQLLKVMRFQLREFLRSVADSWQSVFASAEFLAAVTPDLPLKTAEDRRVLITDLRRRSDAAPTEATNREILEGQHAVPNQSLRLC